MLRGVTASVGVAAYPAHGKSVADLLRAADAALYAAKRQGRDRVESAQLK
jgi:diguanylate cyclase (GGDEF)-like protein